MTLDAVSLFQRVKNVTNIIYVNICGTVKRLAGFLQPNGGKVKDAEDLK